MNVDVRITCIKCQEVSLQDFFAVENRFLLELPMFMKPVSVNLNIEVCQTVHIWIYILAIPWIINVVKEIVSYKCWLVYFLLWFLSTRKMFCFSLFMTCIIERLSGTWPYFLWEKTANNCTVTINMSSTTKHQSWD